MLDLLSFLVWPFLALLVVAGLHVYLGLHVVEREVIFVDLALAQMAVLGAHVASFWEAEAHGTEPFLFGLGFTVLGALVFSLTRSERTRIPQEAIIGIVYAVAAAATVLILNYAPHGTEHIRDVLVGQLLAVGPKDVATLFSLYVVIGLLHAWWRKPLMLISRQPEEARTRGMNIKLWDFLFYVTFGLTVTASVAICGVLVVFSYLIVPSVTAMLFAERVGARLAIGWVVAGLASALGLLTSIWISAPPGASVVCVFGGLLLVAALMRPWLVRRGRPAPTI